MSIKNNISSLQEVLNTINSLPEAGTDLPELSNEGTASDLLSGKQLIDSEGNVVNGVFTIDEELTTQDNLIAQIQTALEGKAAGLEPTLQEKTVSPTTSSQTVTPDSGYDGLSKVTVNAIPSTYVEPTATKAATTYTPTTSDQMIASGTYCSGTQTIKGDSNLVADNIKSGVSIFGVAGSYEGSGSSSSLPTISSGFVESTATGSVIYTINLNGSISTTQADLVYLSFAKKYRHPLGEGLLANTPIIVLTSGTITMPTATGYTATLIASGTGYAVYKYV